MYNSSRQRFTPKYRLKSIKMFSSYNYIYIVTSHLFIKYILRINSINDKYVHVDASQISGSRKPDNNQQSPLLTNRPEARSDLCHYLIHKLEQATTISDFKLLTTIIENVLLHILILRDSCPSWLTSSK